MDKYVVINLKNKAVEEKIMRFLAAEVDESDYECTEDLTKYVAEHCNVKVENFTENNEVVAPPTMDRNIVPHGAAMTTNDPNFQSTSSDLSFRERIMKGTNIAYRYRMMEPKQEPMDEARMENEQRVSNGRRDTVNPALREVKQEPIEEVAAAPPTMGQNVVVDRALIDENDAPSSAPNRRRGTVNPALIEVKQELMEVVMVEERIGNEARDVGSVVKREVDDAQNDYGEIMEDVSVDARIYNGIDDNSMIGMDDDNEQDNEENEQEDNELDNDENEQDNEHDTAETLPLRRQSGRIAKRARMAIDVENEPAPKKPSYGGRGNCQKCGVSKKYYGDKANHVFACHTELKKYECLICHYQTAHFTSIEKHMERKYKKKEMNNYKEIVITPEQEEEYQNVLKECFPEEFSEEKGCQVCQRVIGTNAWNPSWNKRHHAYSHLDFMRFKCVEEGCTYKEKTESSMNSHAKMKHGDGKFVEIKLTRKQKAAVEQIVYKCFPKIDESESEESEDEDESDDDSDE